MNNKRKVIRLHLIKGRCILTKIRKSENKAMLKKCLSKLFNEKNTLLNKTECCFLAFKKLKRSALVHMHELSPGRTSPAPVHQPFNSNCTATLCSNTFQKTDCRQPSNDYFQLAKYYQVKSLQPNIQLLARTNTARWAVQPSLCRKCRGNGRSCDLRGGNGSAICKCIKIPCVHLKLIQRDMSITSQ